MGMLTLNAKLVDLSDEKLLIRVVSISLPSLSLDIRLCQSLQTEVWNFFFIGCLPYVEGIFLPLRTDPALRPPNATGSMRSLHSASSNANRGLEAIDIRSIALRSFRDHLILPIVDRVSFLDETMLTTAMTDRIAASSPVCSHISLAQSRHNPSNHQPIQIHTRTCPRQPGLLQLGACKWSASSHPYKPMTIDKWPLSSWEGRCEQAWRDGHR
jgi:hypothetical protein